MEKARAFLEPTQEESDRVSSLAFPPHRVGTESTFYDCFALRGIRFDRVEPGLVFCTFKVPPRLADRQGKLAAGAIANVVDSVGALAVYVEGRPMNVSVDMSISFLSSANIHDELEIIGQVLGRKGGYSGTSVVVKNKATGELIAEGRHSLFGRLEQFSAEAWKMEKAKAFLEATQEESNRVSSLHFPPHRIGAEFSFYDCFALRGIRVDRVEPGSVYCTFKVPPRLTNREGKLGAGAIANLVDLVGSAVVCVEGFPVSVSVDMSISFLSTANTNDELMIIGQVLGSKGGYSGTSVVVKNKATGELIAEGRLSLFGKYASKI